MATDYLGAFGITYIPVIPGLHHADVYFNGVKVAGKLYAVANKSFQLKIILLAYNATEVAFIKHLAIVGFIENHISCTSSCHVSC